MNVSTNINIILRNEIESAQKLGKHIVLAGCVPQGAPKSSFVQGLSIIGVQQIDRVVEVVDETLKGNTVKLLGKKVDVSKKIVKSEVFRDKEGEWKENRWSFCYYQK